MIYLLLFLTEVVLLTLLEKKQWGHLMTPLNLLAWPYTIAVLMIAIYRLVEPDIPKFYYPSLIIWMIGLLLFEIPSFLIATKTPVRFKRNDFEISICKNDDYYKLLKQFAYFCIAISLFKINSLTGSLDSFGSDEFSEQYQTSGIFAHLSVVLSCIFSFAIYKLDSKHKSAYIVILGSLIGMYAVGTKSWIIAPILIGYYARLMVGKNQIAIKTIIFPVIVVFFIFFFSYLLTLVYVGNNDVSSDFFIFICNHFVDYFCGGALSLGIDFQKGFLEPQMSEALFGPILNFIYMITGHSYVNVINPVFIDLGDLGEGNVRTFFGTIYAYSKSPLLFIIMSFVFSIYTNLLFSKSRSSISPFLLLANSANLVFLTFGFFDFYWLTLSCYEIPVIFLLMHYFLYKKSVNIRPIKLGINLKIKRRW